MYLQNNKQKMFTQYPILLRDVTIGMQTNRLSEQCEFRKIHNKITTHSNIYINYFCLFQSKYIHEIKGINNFICDLPFKFPK